MRLRRATTATAATFPRRLDAGIRNSGDDTTNPRSNWKDHKQRRPELFTARWKRLSIRWRREHPLCAPCEAKGRVTLGKQVDHIDPDHPDYYDEANLQTICIDCHNLKTMADRGYRPKLRIGLDGLPVDDGA